MRHYPIFVDLRDRTVVVSGVGDVSASKLRLLMKTEARIEVYGIDPAAEVRKWACEGRIVLVERPIEPTDAAGAELLYAANGDADQDARAATIGRAAGALVNIVDNLEDSDFITPAIVDREPVTVAIGTEGAAPVLARKIKADIEAMLPASIGVLARIGQRFRTRIGALNSRARRDFWSRFYLERGPRAVVSGADAVHEALEALLAEGVGPRTGFVHLVGAGPGDPELLTLRARRLLHDADVVIHDRLVSTAILELARREATLVDVGKSPFAPSWTQDEISALIIRHATAGATVVRLKGGDPVVYGRLDDEVSALEAAGVHYGIVPGVTSASAAAAAISQSLTRRGRNSSLRILTGHDVEGFAEHDWRELAKPGATAAIYMGVSAATFLRGRLMIHGAPSTTPVTAVENASRPDQRIIATTLIYLPAALAEAAPKGPVMILYGLAPRAASGASSQVKEAL